MKWPIQMKLILVFQSQFERSYIFIKTVNVNIFTVETEVLNKNKHI